MYWVSREEDVVTAADVRGTQFDLSNKNCARLAWDNLRETD